VVSWLALDSKSPPIFSDCEYVHLWKAKFWAIAVMDIDPHASNCYIQGRKESFRDKKRTPTMCMTILISLTILLKHEYIWPFKFMYLIKSLSLILSDAAPATWSWLNYLSTKVKKKQSQFKPVSGLNALSPIVSQKNEGWHRVKLGKVYIFVSTPSAAPRCILMALKGKLTLNTDKGTASLHCIASLVGILQNWAYVHCTSCDWLHQESVL